MANNDALQEKVIAWVAARPRDEIRAILDRFEVVSAPVNDASDIVADPHFTERTLVELTGSDVLGSVLMPGPVLHLASYGGPGTMACPRSASTPRRYSPSRSAWTRPNWVTWPAAA